MITIFLQIKKSEGKDKMTTRIWKVGQTIKAWRKCYEIITDKVYKEKKF